MDTNVAILAIFKHISTHKRPASAAPVMITDLLTNPVKNGTPAPVPTSQILYNQAIIDGIVKSAKLGHEIKIEIPEV